MSEENTINQDMLEIVKALSAKVEALEQTIYAKDSLLMKAGLVVSSSPTPAMDNTIGGAGAIPTTDVASMDWSDIHKMMNKLE
tara:strand:+ start:2716 stop:2964 length:249 start_codon:yes stop_codon:yes gene_type:complete